MHYIFDKDGESHIIRGGADLQKALGAPGPDRRIIMTDESGEVVGAGTSGKKLMESFSLVKSLRDGSLLKSMRENEPLHKYRPKKQSLAKSLSRRQTAGCFDQLVRELDQLRRGMYA